MASLKEYNPEPVEPFLEKLSLSVSPDQLEPIKRKIESFDFDSAAKEIEKLANILALNPKILLSIPSENGREIVLLF